jgi:hypothetical protein
MKGIFINDNFVDVKEHKEYIKGNFKVTKANIDDKQKIINIISLEDSDIEFNFYHYGNVSEIVVDSDNIFLIINYQDKKNTLYHYKRLSSKYRFDIVKSLSIDTCKLDEENDVIVTIDDINYKYNCDTLEIEKNKIKRL